MTGHRGLSLRYRIAGGVFAGLIVLFLSFGLLAVRTVELSIEVVLAERLRLAQTSAASVDELLEHTARQLERTAAFVARGSAAAAEGRAREAYALLGEFDRIVNLSPEGRVLWVVPPLPDDSAWPFTEDAPVRAALERSETSIVAPKVGNRADGLIAIVITPLDGGSPSTGFLAGELRAAHANIDLLSFPHAAGSLHSEIIDAAGYIVARFGDEASGRPDEHLDVLIPMIASGQPGTTTHRVAGGVDHVVAYYPFRTTPGGVVVEQAEDAALVLPQEMQRTMLIFGVVALVIASGAAWLHANSVMRPIRRLSEDAARMASGDLESPILVSRDDEIGELAHRFDEMRVRLKSSLEESATWTEELERRVAERTREVEDKNRELHALSRIRRQLLAKTISAQEEERIRLARELHDDSAQTVTAALMTLKSAEDALPAASHVARRAMDRSRTQLELALREIRKAIVDLRPSALDDLGLATAVRSYATNRLGPLGIKVAFRVSGDEKRATGAAATAIFRIAQEAINNVARHSGAREAKISLTFGDAAVVTVVEDNGTGFDPDVYRHPDEGGRGLGLLGMRERAGLFGGSVEIAAGTGHGTSVRVRVPYE